MRNDRMIVLGAVTIVVALIAIIFLGDGQNANGSSERNGRTEKRWGNEITDRYKGKNKG